MKQTVNITLKIDDSEIIGFEGQLIHWFGKELISFKIIPNTDELYERSEGFRKLVKAEKISKRNKEKFINEYNKKNGLRQ